MRMANRERDVSVKDLQDRRQDMDMNLIKGELRTPLKVKQISEEQYSSSPRDGIRDAFSLMHAQGNPLRRRRGASQLPKLTGAARERFKIQKKRVEQWQASESVDSTAAARKRENKKLKSMRKKQRRAQRARLAAEEATNALKVPNKIIPLRSGRVYDRSMAREGNTAPGSTLRPCSETVPSINKVLNHMTFQDTEEEIGRGVQGVHNMGMKAPLTSREGQCSPTTVQSYTTQRGQDKQDRRRPTLVLKNHDLAATKYKVLVDYELPEGDARLDWDTDYIRQLFGEIA